MNTYKNGTVEFPIHKFIWLHSFRLFGAILQKPIQAPSERVHEKNESKVGMWGGEYCCVEHSVALFFPRRDARFEEV